MTRAELESWWAQATPRERDARVARQVLRWDIQRVPPPEEFVGSPTVAGVAMVEAVANRIPRFTKDWSALPQVLAAVMNGFGLSVVILDNAVEVQRTEAPRGEPFRKFVVRVDGPFAEVLPEAVCKAALLACEGQSANGMADGWAVEWRVF